MSTEPRSRDEWLVEVKRRGERMRRRRQVTVAVLGALAMVLPLSAVAGFLTAESDPGQELSVAGPAPASQVTTHPGIAAPTQPAPAEEPATTTTTAQPQPRIEAVPDRTALVTPGGLDDPVVRVTTTATAATANVTASLVPPPSTTIPAPPEQLPPCAPADIKLTFSLEKDAFRPGEVVRGSTELERQPGVVCMLPFFDEFEILNSAGTNVVADGVGIETVTSSFSGGEGPPSVKGSFAWEAIDCTPQRLSPIVPAPGDRTGCIAFPAGTYTVVPSWHDSSLSARKTFQLAI